MCKLVFEDQNIEGAIALLDRRDRIEKALLQILNRQPNGYYNALQNVSRNTRFIYVHGYQSFVWNRAVSLRLNKFGNKVLIGDLVVKKGAAHLIDNQDVEADAEEANEEGDKEEETEKKEPKDIFIDVTEENIGEFTIYDVVMPLVGHSIRMP